MNLRINIIIYMDKQSIEKLQDEIYYQKLGAILKLVNDWRDKKKARFNQVYYAKIETMLKKAEIQYNQIHNQIQALIEIIDSEGQFLSGLKQSKIVKKIKQKPNRLQMDPSFQLANQLFLKKRQTLLQLKKFTLTFVSILSQQLSSIDKCYNHLNVCKRELQLYLKEIQKGQFKGIEGLTGKKTRKIFSLKKLELIREILHRQVKDASKSFNDLSQYITKMRNQRGQSLCNIITNMNHFRRLYFDCFGIDFGGNLVEFYQNKYQKVQESQKNIQINQENIESLQEINKNMMSTIISQFQTLVEHCMREITVRQIQIQIQVGRQIFTNQIGYITIDNMLLLADKTKKIGRQIDLMGAQACDLNQSEGKITLKIKNHRLSEHYLIKFPTEERLDQFMLHLQQINQRFSK